MENYPYTISVTSLSQGDSSTDGSQSKFLWKNMKIIPKQSLLLLRLRETVLMMGHNASFYGKILKILSRKRGIILSKKPGGLPPLLVWVPLLIVKYSEFQVYIFSINRDIKQDLSQGQDSSHNSALPIT